MPRPVIPIEPPYTPELLPLVASWLEWYLYNHPGSVFEYGAGHSTVWWAGIAGTVVSVEHDPSWYEETQRALDEADPPGAVELILVDHEDDIAAAIDDYGEFDIVLVDCLDRQRVNAIRRAVGHVKPGGYLVLDDSHWGKLRPGRKILSNLGWHKTKISGAHTRKNGDVRQHETSIYRRPE